MTMNSTHNIPSMQELAELATLDAYGLLDESDLFRLEQAMLHAPSDVRASVRAIQDEIATDEHLLPEATPPATLRQQVIDRVRAAVDLHDTAHAAGTMPPNGLQDQPLSFSQATLRSVWTWRMAALVLLGACVALVVVKERQQQHFNRVIHEAISLQADSQLKDTLGSSYATFVSLMERPDVRHIYLVGPHGDGAVRLSVDEDTGQMYAFGMDLAGQDGCALELRTSTGEVVARESFLTDRYLAGIALQVDPSDLAGLTACLVTSDGQVIAKSALTA